ncbi:MAG TPA: hypothetical protein VGX28_13950 [Frankiaceae bacterium]|jgi:hypothetical protein|nr:hypothetical protein [Frankiaceae bacterium]
MDPRRITVRLGLLTAAPALLAALTAGRADASLVGGGAVVAITPVATHNVAATLSYDATPFPGGAFVEFNCKVVAWVDPASTGLDTCSVAGQEAVGSPNNVPGPASAAAGLVWVPDGTRPVACVQGHATFAEGSVGPLAMSTPARCQALTLLAVAP